MDKNKNKRRKGLKGGEIGVGRGGVKKGGEKKGKRIR